MKRKIHKKDLPLIETLYDRLLLFYGFVQTCPDNLRLMHLTNKKNSIEHTIYAYCSLENGDEQIVSIENKEVLMLRLYNILLDAIKLLGDHGSMDTFLGLTVFSENQNHYIWIKISATRAETTEKIPLRT